MRWLINHLHPRISQLKIIQSGFNLWLKISSTLNFVIHYTKMVSTVINYSLFIHLAIRALTTTSINCFWYHSNHCNLEKKNKSVQFNGNYWNILFLKWFKMHFPFQAPKNILKHRKLKSNNMQNNEIPNRKMNRFAFSDFWEFPSIDRMTYRLFDMSKTMEFHYQNRN